MSSKNSISLRSPGRINLIGEHTDYNQGYVLPAAIDRNIAFRITKNNDSGIATFYTADLNARFEVRLEDIKPGTGWENYILGVLKQLELRGIQVSGFECNIESILPVGAGLSSSAALECGLAYGLNSLFDLKLTEWDMIELAQAAEHNYVGTQCGIMDQFACVKGKAGHFMLLDCRNLEYRYIPAHLGNFSLLLLNTGVSHALASSAYNQRRESCMQGVAILARSNPEVKSLRDITADMLASVKSEMPSEMYRRCSYIVGENQRVLMAVSALESGNMQALGSLLFETHQGLRDDYEVSCPELDFLVDRAHAFQGVAGARLVGGGFGGCTLNLVKKDVLPEFQKGMTAAYYEHFKKELIPIPVELAEGVGPFS